jgi:hypothetical protein
MINNQLKNIKKNLRLGGKNTFKKKTCLNRVLSSHSGHESTKFC